MESNLNLDLSTARNAVIAWLYNFEKKIFKTNICTDPELCCRLWCPDKLHIVLILHFPGREGGCSATYGEGLYFMIETFVSTYETCFHFGFFSNEWHKFGVLLKIALSNYKTSSSKGNIVWLHIYTSTSSQSSMRKNWIIFPNLNKAKPDTC